MPWVEIELPAAELSLQADGVVMWSSALQLMMGDPKWVDLMWDAAARTLGVRAVNSATGFPVHGEPEGGEYKIDSVVALQAAGISVGSTHAESPPAMWYQKESDGWSEWFGYNPIYYMTLPE